MRFREFHLVAWGHFTEVTLHVGEPGLHILVGRNEAGKSTALRGLTSFLYGIEQHTRDAHRHPMPVLRLGATLESDDGSSVTLFRRKGRGLTLTDERGSPIDEEVLSSRLGGVTREVFQQTFGLDHQTLRMGGEALLSGGGDLGESLFAASLGGVRLHDLLRRLRQRADALFTPRSKSMLINTAMREYEEAAREVRMKATSAEAWTTQKAALDERRARLVEIEQRVGDLLTQKSRLDRLLRARPLIHKRAALLAQLAPLEAVPHLDPESSVLRERAEREHELADQALRQAEDDQERLLVDGQGLGEPSSLESLEDPLVEELSERVGLCRSAERELPSVREALARSEDQMRMILHRVGKLEWQGKVGELRLSTLAIAELRKLCQSTIRAALRRTELSEARHKLLAEHATLTAQLMSLPQSYQGTPLDDARKSALRDGDLEARLRQLAQELVTEARAIDTEMEGLGLGDMRAEGLLSLRLPSALTVTRFEHEISESSRVLTHARLELAELEREMATCEQQLARINRRGPCPTEEELARARRVRDEIWRELRSSHDEPGATVSTSRHLGAFEDSMGVADDVADRLFREADRVARTAALELERDLLAQRHRTAMRALEESRVACDSVGEAWRQQFAGSDLRVLPPAEMREVLARMNELRDRVVALSTSGLERQALEERLSFHVRALSRLLPRSESTLRINDEEEPLSLLLDRADILVENLRALDHERRQVRSRLLQVTAELEAVAQRQLSHSVDDGALQGAWEQALRPLGLPVSASPEQVSSLLDELQELFLRAEEADMLRARVAGSDRERELLTEELASHCRAHAVELLALPTLEQGARFLRSCREALARRARRHDLQQRQKDVAVRREVAMLHRERALAALRGLMQKAKADTLEGLRDVERRGIERARLEADLQRVTDQALELGGGSPVEDIEHELGQSRPDAMSAELLDVEDEIDKLQGERGDVRQEIGSIEGGFRVLERGEDSAEAALRAESSLAKLRSHVEEYVRFKLSSVLLGREIERYRAASEGPILRRARELFERLTVGAFNELRVHFDERGKGIICCVRASGREEGMEALSDGTRDQLYLALRLSTIEHHLARRESIPLVLDDALVHFDDERARAALSVLGECTEKTQVLFFTHHPRLRDLAREVIPSSRLHEHTL